MKQDTLQNNTSKTKTVNHLPMLYQLTYIGLGSNSKLYGCIIPQNHIKVNAKSDFSANFCLFATVFRILKASNNLFMYMGYCTPIAVNLHTSATTDITRMTKSFQSFVFRITLDLTLDSYLFKFCHFAKPPRRQNFTSR